MKRTTTTLALSLVASAFASAAACSSGQPASPTPPPPNTMNGNFTADPPAVYVAKVKQILVGLPPTDDEVKAVEADATKFAGLIDGWMKLPEYAAKMMVFFELAFQQTQIGITDLSDQAYPRVSDPNQYSSPLLLQNVKESFARTVLELIAEGRPFTDVTTTTRFMMTPALMELYGFYDVWNVDDTVNVKDYWKLANPSQQLYVGSASIPLTETLDPTNANFMHWTNPDVPAYNATQPAACQRDPIVYTNPNASTLHYIITGAIDGRQMSGTRCQQRGGSQQASQLTATDFTTWKMVNIRPPNGNEPTTPFWNLNQLRDPKTMDLVIKYTPRIGFFSTPAFFANWQTNTSNEGRVTLNQTLIVALGAQVDGSDPTTVTSTPGLDSKHANNPACVSCHQTLDPTRSIIGATYSWNYHQQVDQTWSNQKGQFQFQGVIKPVNSINDFGAILAQHPLFASAWVQKLCYYANSNACELDDPEFQRVVGVFQKAYSWNDLVRELMASPLTTNAAPTKTAMDKGDTIAVARRDHLCAALNFRLGFNDVCALDATGPKAQLTTIPEIVSGLPSDGYGRGSVAPVLPNQPSLFYRAGTENICESVAQSVVDPTKPIQGVMTWSSTQPDKAISDFVSIVMGLVPSDARNPQAQMLLKSHFTQAMSNKATTTDALRSTFTLACLAPSTLAIGL